MNIDSVSMNMNILKRKVLLALSDETKRKLEALEIDTKTIKTEEEGKIALKKAEDTQNTKNNDTTKINKQSTMPEIKEDAQKLAHDVGAIVGQTARIDDMLEKAKDKIKELKSAAGKDFGKMSKVDSYQAQYESIYTRYIQAQATQNMMGASALANYNKYMLNI